MFAFGAKADMCSAKRHVSFTPESGHVQRTCGCLLWANSGHLVILVISRAHAAKRRALIGGEWGVRVGLDAIVNQLKAVSIFSIMVRPHRASSSTRQSNAKCRAMRSDW